MKRIIGTLIIVYSMLMTMACPTSTKVTLQKTKESSNKIAGYANGGVNLTRELYQSNFLSLGQKDAIAAKFIILADAGIAFDATVNAAIAQYGNSNAAPASVVQQIAGMFDAKVVNAFLDILMDLKVISAKGNYASIIDLIRTAVITVAGVLNIKSQVTNKIQAVEA